MAQTLEQLDRSAATLESIGGIVRTMKTMSAINAAPFEAAARAIDAYRDTVLEGLHAFVRSRGPLDADALQGDAAVEVAVAFGSDHGLCGGYNEAVAAAVADLPARRLICVGAQLEDALGGVARTPEAVLAPPASVDGLGRLATQLVTRLEQIRGSAPAGVIGVTLVTTERLDQGRQAPVVQRLLPLDPAMLRGLAAAPWKSRSLPQIGPPPATMLAALLRAFLFSSLVRAGAEAMLTENAARLARMQQAEQSVDDRLEALKAETRAVRQNQITTELLDVVIGFEALNKRQRRSGRRRPSQDGGQDAGA